MLKRPKQNHFLFVIIVLSSGVFSDRVFACDRSCRLQARRALCDYTKCVLLLKEKDRFDAKDRRDKCGLVKDGKRGRDKDKDEDDVGDFFKFEEGGCLPSLTTDVADLFAETCADGALRIKDACEWGRMYVNLSCEAEAKAKVASSSQQIDPVRCQDPCPSEECIDINNCVTVGNRNKCLRLQEEGCQDIITKESCPVQYNCADATV